MGTMWMQMTYKELLASSQSPSLGLLNEASLLKHRKRGVVQGDYHVVADDSPRAAGPTMVPLAALRVVAFATIAMGS